jgi:hypothetical protein
VGYLADEQVQGDVDDLLASAATSSGRLMNRLIHLGWKPVGEVPTLIFGGFLFIHSYGNAREGGAEVAESLDLAHATMLEHPVIQRFFAAKTSAAINTAAGVE